MIPAAQRGGITAAILWTALAMAVLVALAAFGTWHALQALDSLGVVRVSIEGHEVLDGIRWSHWSASERAWFAVLIGFVLLMVLLIVPIVIVGALVIAFGVTAVVIAISLAPIVLPVLLLIWLVRRLSSARRPSQ